MNWLWEQWCYEWQWRVDSFMKNLGHRLRPSTWPQLARRIFICGALLFGPLLILAWVTYIFLYALIIATWMAGVIVLLVLSVALWPLESLWKLW